MYNVWKFARVGIDSRLFNGNAEANILLKDEFFFIFRVRFTILRLFYV